MTANNPPRPASRFAAAALLVAEPTPVVVLLPEPVAAPFDAVVAFAEPVAAALLLAGEDTAAVPEGEEASTVR